ncbi:UvrD-helicase domain-containing protein [Enterococcus plantarum]|uniref:UvrD-helicase domain-containing protein n=1 Tax=Enterococcus plantarum TaxID=1077675 RepID=UPI000DA8DC58|nr:UvrD-helicase domain-containing protein [Enterococcus plantarum]
MGNSDLVSVSTIHEKIWEIIAPYQNELLLIHKEKLEEIVANKEAELSDDSNKKTNFYREMTEEAKTTFKETMLLNKEQYYNTYSMSGPEFKQEMEKLLDKLMFKQSLKNVSNFKNVVSTIYSIDNNNIALKEIKTNNPKYKKVKYTPLYHRDSLHRMSISHDTLLEYGLKIISKYPLLNRMVIDKYPYIFIDEYQDTNELIVKLMSHLADYAKENKQLFLVGYFGDTAQNIYDDGIGSNLKNIQNGLVDIDKKFNRRSADEIIGLINRIRDDNISQESIYSDSYGGTVDFLGIDSEQVEEEVKHYREEWKKNGNQSFACLVLTNQLVAKYNGFQNIYGFFKNSPYYIGSRYNQLNTELMDKKLESLGEIQKMLRNFIKLFSIIDNNMIVAKDLSYDDLKFPKLTFLEFKNLVSKLKGINKLTINEMLVQIEREYKKSNSTEGKYFRTIIESIFNLEEFSIKNVTNYIMESLEIEESEEVTKGLYELPFKEFKNWFDFISGEITDGNCFVTYHGTKGLEFDGIVIIMSERFNNRPQIRDYFSLRKEDNESYEKIKNLLYVACSRARKNLAILYVDNVEEIKEGLQEKWGIIVK